MDLVTCGFGLFVLFLGLFIFWHYAKIGDGNNIPPFGLLISIIGIVVSLIGYIR
jgi:hypothetical protein